jgi:hypothetical protein
VIVFDDMGEILPGGRVIPPRVPAPVRLPEGKGRRNHGVRQPVTNQVTTLPRNVKRSATPSGGCILLTCGNPTQREVMDETGMHGKENVYGSIP